jgi:hypothetical protein
MTKTNFYRGTGKTVMILGMGIQSLDSCQMLDHYKEAYAINGLG